MKHVRVSTMIAFAILAQLLGPRESIAQTVAAGIYVDPDWSLGETITGPAVLVGVKLHGPFRLEAGLARTDFPVGTDQLHRYTVTGVLGSDVVRTRTQTSLGLFLGAGIMVQDDLNETDPSFRSSANGYSVVVPGISVRRSLANGRSLNFMLRDYMSVSFDVIFDRTESDIGHNFFAVVGVTF